MGNHAEIPLVLSALLFGNAIWQFLPPSNIFNQIGGLASIALGVYGIFLANKAGKRS